MWLCINDNVTKAGHLWMGWGLKKSGTALLQKCDLGIVGRSVDGVWGISERVTFLVSLSFLISIMYYERHNCHYYVPTIYTEIIIKIYTVCKIASVKKSFYSQYQTVHINHRVTTSIDTRFQERGKAMHHYVFRSWILNVKTPP